MQLVTDNTAYSSYYSEDVDHQAATINYAYDSIGNLTADAAEKITNISWTVYGKIASIVKNGATISYSYDAAGNRITKTVGGITTLYVRDASGNVMSVYELPAANTILQKEVHLYGSSRIGIVKVDNEVVERMPLPGGGDMVIRKFTRGNKFFETTNHLGNVLATVTDRKLRDALGWAADVVSATDYAPLGMALVGRSYSSEKYRYGFNGQEKSTEIDGNGNSMTAEFWQYDARLGRRWNVDPRPKVGVSFYSCFNGNPLIYMDIHGDTTINGQLMEGTNSASATYLEEIVLKSGYKRKPLTPIVESAYDDSRQNENTIMAKDIIKHIWNNSEIGKKISEQIPKMPGVPGAGDILKKLLKDYSPSLYNAAEVMVKNREMPIDMAIEGVGLLNPAFALFNRTVISSMINDVLKEDNLIMFDVVDRSWQNLDNLNAAIWGACSREVCLFKKDYLGVITVTQKQFETIMTDKFVVPKDYKPIQISKNNIEGVKQDFFSGETPKYYILFNKLASKGYLHVSEIGYAPIIIPNK